MYFIRRAKGMASGVKLTPECVGLGDVVGVADSPTVPHSTVEPRLAELNHVPALTAPDRMVLPHTRSGWRSHRNEFVFDHLLFVDIGDQGIGTRPGCPPERVEQPSPARMPMSKGVDRADPRPRQNLSGRAATAWAEAGRSATPAKKPATSSDAAARSQRRAIASAIAATRL
jgi:hypothetical protein